MSVIADRAVVQHGRERVERVVDVVDRASRSAATSRITLPRADGITPRARIRRSTVAESLPTQNAVVGALRRDVRRAVQREPARRAAAITSRSDSTRVHAAMFAGPDLVNDLESRRARCTR